MNIVLLLKSDSSVVLQYAMDSVAFRKDRE